MKWIIAVLCAPAVALGYAFAGLAIALRLARFRRFDRETLALLAEWRPWIAKRWRFATTIGGYGIVLHPFHANTGRTLAHEKVHLRQAQDRTALALILAAILAPTEGIALAAFIWASGPIWQLPNFAMAVLRGGRAYKDSEHERSAYAQTERTPTGRLWIDDWSDGSE